MAAMRTLVLALVLPGLGGCLGSRPAAPPPQDDALPVIPVGLDAYRQWDQWARQRIGARAYMRSTYDRAGGNEGADSSHYLYQEKDGFHVTLDVAGPGVLAFARYNHWHGSPWHYEVDGVDHVVSETSSADPEHPVAGSVFQPEALFPKTLTWTWSVTKGADLMWVPIPFERSFRMAYTRTFYGTGYYIYHHYVRGVPLSRPIVSWDGRTPPDADILTLLARPADDLVPRPGTAEGGRAGLREVSGDTTLPRSQTITLAQLQDAPATIRSLEFSVPREHALAFSRARLRITWDGRSSPSVDAPVALFFGAGTLYNRDNREYLVRAFPVSIRFDAQRVHLTGVFPMPFFRSAHIELAGAPSEPVPGVHWTIRSAPLRDPPQHVAYFHATYRDHPEPRKGHDLVWLDTAETEGGGDWSGHFVGTSWIFSHQAQLRTLEGDPRFFFDDSRTPQAYGTGTEEWGGGGDYWGGENMTLPFAGHPVGARNPASVQNKEDAIESAYRFLLGDLMPFGKRAVIRFEHGGTNESTEHYETVTYWYGAPAPSLVLTDVVDVGDPASEAAHDYHSPDASGPVEVTSRFEWGVDTVDGKEIYPAHTENGRFTRGFSEFSLSLDPRNHGVLLRRTLDYGFPHQRAMVFVSDADAGAPAAWQEAGIWYLAGSNTCFYSRPKGELGATVHTVQTSNRRFRDDEFLLPRDLTAGRTAIRVKVRFIPWEIPLFPGHPPAPQAWSELRYAAYSFVIPSVVTSR